MFLAYMNLFDEGVNETYLPLFKPPDVCKVGCLAVVVLMKEPNAPDGMGGITVMFRRCERFNCFLALSTSAVSGTLLLFAISGTKLPPRYNCENQRGDGVEHLFKMPG